MLKMLKMLAASLAIVVFASVGNAADIKSGTQPGEGIEPFYVTKVAGANTDGVKVGAELCYRCKYGARPQIIVFSRSSDGSVIDLAKQLNELVGKNSEKKLSAFVNLIGENTGELETNAKDLGEKNKLTNIPVVVPTESENGPKNYGINPKAQVTIIFAANHKVVSNLAFEKTLTKEDVKKIVAAVPSILK